MTNEIRRVAAVVHPQSILEGAGVQIKRGFPTYLLDYPDPFLLFDHFGSDDPADYQAGFPMHPHRGIETVTYMLAGAVEHRDSLGNHGVIEAGAVQWMTSGRGILHEEMPQPRQNKMEGFQLWINLPAYLKMTRPKYQEISANQVPSLQMAGGAFVKVIAGEVEGVIGPADGMVGDPTYLDVHMPTGGSFSLPTDPAYTALAYLYRGSAQFGQVPDEEEAESESVPGLPLAYVMPGQEMPGAWFYANKLFSLSEGKLIEARSGVDGARFLLILGNPMREPVMRYGPFVMNTHEEIEETLRDLRNGTFIKT